MEIDDWSPSTLTFDASLTWHETRVLSCEREVDNDNTCKTPSMDHWPMVATNLQQLRYVISWGISQELWLEIPLTRNPTNLICERTEQGQIP